jgi:preprotein translocase subunit YajC
MMKFVFTAGVAAFAMIATPVVAQSNTAAPATAAASVTAGATVYDTEGGVVGTIDSVNGDVAVVATGQNKVGVPVASFGPGDKGPRLAMTRAQLDQAAAGAKAERKAAVTQGANVVDSAGEQVGTVSSVDAQYAVVDMADAQVKLPLNAFSVKDNGLMVGMTKAQLEAATNAAAPAAAPATNTAEPAPAP